MAMRDGDGNLIFKYTYTYSGQICFCIPAIHFSMCPMIPNRSHDDDITELSSPGVRRAPGFQDFTTPSSEEAKRKRRLQPVIPRRARTRAFTQDDGK